MYVLIDESGEAFVFNDNSSGNMFILETLSAITESAPAAGGGGISNSLHPTYYWKLKNRYRLDLRNTNAY